MNIEARKGTVVWVDFGNNPRGEQAGVRPAVVVSVNIMNQKSNTLTVCPLTSRPKRLDLPEHIEVNFTTQKHTKRYSVILCEQIRTISKERVISYGGYIDNEDIVKVNEGIRQLLGL